jgi:hypothetical protein
VQIRRERVSVGVTLRDENQQTHHLNWS